MTDKEWKSRVIISDAVAHFISFFPQAIQSAKNDGDAYVAPRMRYDEIFEVYVESYMDGFYKYFYDEYAEKLDNDTLCFIITSVYGLMLKYSLRSAKRMNAQYEEVYGQR